MNTTTTVKVSTSGALLSSGPYFEECKSFNNGRNDIDFDIVHKAFHLDV